MPALPWITITEAEPDRTYVGFATELPLTARPNRFQQFEVTGRELPLTWPASKERCGAPEEEP